MAERRNRDAVVVGCDGSWQSQRAVETATREAARRASALLLLSVARGVGVAGGLSDLRRFEENAVGAARAIAKRAATVAEATDPAVPVEVVVPASVDAPALDDVIRRAELLVLGGHGGRGQTAFSIGSISGDLARRFRKPILMPHVDGAPPRSVIDDRHPEVHVGLGQRGDERGPLRLAAQEAALRGCALRVIRAVPVAHPGQRLHHELEDTWRAVRSVPECLAVPCQVEVVQDDPVSALLSRCGPDDLLVVGTRGGGTLAGIVQGSVARGVLDVLRCDVIVVPPEAGMTHATDAQQREDGRPPGVCFVGGGTGRQVARLRTGRESTNLAKTGPITARTIT